jgi:hypothetical protein
MTSLSGEDPDRKDTGHTLKGVRLSGSLSGPVARMRWPPSGTNGTCPALAALASKKVGWATTDFTGHTDRRQFCPAGNVRLRTRAHARGDEMSIDRSLHVLLHYLATTNGGGARSDVEVFEALAAEVPDVSHVDIAEAARRAKQLGSELRKLAWQIEQARKREKRAHPFQPLP